MVDMPIDSCFVLAMRHLPTYKSVSMLDLRMAFIDSGLLFEENKVKESLKMTDKTAATSFQQVVVRALVKPCLTPSSPLLEQGSSTLSLSVYISLIGLTHLFTVQPCLHRKGQQNQYQVLTIPQEDYGQVFRK